MGVLNLGWILIKPRPGKVAPLKSDEGIVASSDNGSVMPPGENSADAEEARQANGEGNGACEGLAAAPSIDLDLEVDLCGRFK